MNSTISASSIFFLIRACDVAKVILLVSFVTTRALLLPNALMFEPPPCWRIIINHRNPNAPIG